MSSSRQPHGLDFLWPPRTIAHQVTLSLGFPKKKHWSGLLFPSRGGFPDPKVEPGSPVLQVDSLPLRSPSRLCLKQGIPLISPLSYVPSSSQSPPPTHTYTHTCTHTCTQTHTCTHTHAHARAHTHTHWLWTFIHLTPSLWKALYLLPSLENFDVSIRTQVKWPVTPFWNFLCPVCWPPPMRFYSTLPFSLS